ncbi:hypothetical protein HY025_02625 [Candidatus Daviesbacteria bacterium]|nr:hypothetical protein [Candidatus Daviesbacteria bacterium]
MNPLKFITRHYVIIIITFFFILLIANFIYVASKQWQVYIRPFYPKRYLVLKGLFDQSQYVKAYSPIIIPDEYYYALAGWNYLHSQDPILFNGEQPPLGKYFVSLTISLFNNETLTGPIFNLLSLLALFLLGSLVLQSKIWSLVMTSAFSFEKIFQVQMIYMPLLDNIQLFFILLSFYFFLIWWRGKLSILPAFIFLGLVASVKFWITAFVIYLAWLLAVFLYKAKSKLIFLIYTPVSLLVLLISYIPSYIQGDSFRRILGVQKYIYVYHSGKFHFDPLAFFDLLLFNRWHVTWENTIKPSVDFQITWPILLILSIFAIYKIFKKQKRSKDKKLNVIALWFVMYVAFLFFGTILARYLIPVLPAMYLLSFYIIKDFVKK